jgi:hypothetical protein
VAIASRISSVGSVRVSLRRSIMGSLPSRHRWFVP